jgi:hypothetical protein
MQDSNSFSNLFNPQADNAKTIHRFHFQPILT